MPYLLFTVCGIMWTLISLPPQMAERLRRAQPVSVTNRIKARQSLIERAVTWLATESGWARGKHPAICSGKLCGGFIIFEQCCPYAWTRWKTSCLSVESVNNANTFLLLWPWPWPDDLDNRRLKLAPYTIKMHWTVMNTYSTCIFCFYYFILRPE